MEGFKSVIMSEIQRQVISPDSSAWVRSLRQLFEHGKPVGNIVALTISTDGQLRRPFGLLTYTGKHRLIFWPILPPGMNSICEGGVVEKVDHVTLEFPKKKIHVTAYDKENKAIHYRREWKARAFESYGLEMWFSMLVRRTVVEQQDMEMFRNVLMPRSDKDRRLKEFENFITALRIANIHLPPMSAEDGDYLHLAIYFGAVDLDEIPPSIYPTGPSMTAQVEEWETNPFPIAPTKFQFADRIIYVACSRPPGKLRPDVSIGFGL